MSPFLPPCVHGPLATELEVKAALIDEGSAPVAANGGFREEEADLAIRFGEGDWPGWRVDKLMDVSALPLCSPRLLEGRRPLRRPDDLRHHTLLHDDTDYAGRPEWRAWLAAAGVDGIDAARGPRFNQAALALDAAAAEGQGVTLTLEPLARADLAAGRLAAPFEVRLRLKPAYYLVCPEGVIDSPSPERVVIDAIARRCSGDAALMLACASSATVSTLESCPAQWSRKLGVRTF